MKSNITQPLQQLAAVAASMLALNGCAYLPSPPSESTITSQATPPAKKLFVDEPTNRYLRLDATTTGVQNVADDGNNTFVLFAAAPGKLDVFDQDGKPLRLAVVANVAAVLGRHEGLLIRTPSGTSFVAPNPRASTEPLAALATDPHVLEARALLEGEGSQKMAYQRALALAATKAATPAIAKPVAATTATPAAELPAIAKPIVITTATPPSATEDSTYVREPNGVLMRVFFASGGRSVVRPDDGLSRLAKEAQSAQQVRITGYTDNLGTAALNSVLAQQRAEAVRNHLIKSGVPADRILVQWNGATDFMAENSSDKGRALNRRVEVKMIQTTMAAKN